MGANLKEVRERIRSVISTQQITKAMKMVSAAKLRRAQQAIVQLRPYSQKLEAMMGSIMANVDGGDATSSYGVAREVNSVLMVVVTSNRGLCGAFNTNIIKSAVETINRKYAAQRDAGKLTVLCIGKRGNDYFRRRDYKMITDYVEIFSDLSFDNVSQVPNRLMAEFTSKKYDAIEISYGRFKNAAMQFAETEQFLPVAKVAPVKGASTKKVNYAFEPNETELLEDLIPNILQVQFQKCLLDTHASEHGARMTSMDKATENADEMLKALKIHYNKARQEAITKELSEIVGGAAALNG
jgi:F-type H+-transporting ATPase subunit gamma